MNSTIKYILFYYAFFIILIILPLSSKCQVDIDKLIISAENGDPNAQYKLGNLYFSGSTKLPKSEEKSIYWHKLAAMQDHVDAQLCLAAAYSGFLDTQKDLNKVIYWYKKAAVLGSAKALFELGLINYYGEGMTIDLLKSSEYLKNAVLIDANILKDKKAFLYDRRPMRNKNIILDLADSFYFGVNGVKINKSLAFFWYEKCAEDLEIDDAQCNLGIMYENGEGALKNLKKAFFWFSKAANKGNIEAQYSLGNYYEQGKGTLKNINKAVYWWTQAANRDNPKAQFNLAVTYCYGRGISKNLVKAAHWAQKAYNNGFDEINELWEKEELWKYIK